MYVDFYLLPNYIQIQVAANKVAPRWQGTLKKKYLPIFYIIFTSIWVEV